jgi:outer membrane protein assembly factor BamB
MKTVAQFMLFASLISTSIASAQTEMTPLWDFVAEPRMVRDPLTGEIRLLPAYIFGAPAVGSDGTVYFGSGAGKFYALTPQGSQKWSFSTDAEIQSSAAIGADGTIYFGSVDRNVYALNPDGTLRWKFTTGDYVLSSPAIGNDGTIYIGSRDHHLYAINPDGTQKWRFATGRYVDSAPVIGMDGTIYIGSYDFNLYALRPDGTERWRLTYGSGPAGGLGVAVALATNGAIYASVAGSENSLYALDPTGATRWHYLFGPETALVGPTAPVIGADGTIYLGTPDRMFYAINPDGTRRWALPTGTAGHSTATLASDGMIYFSTWDMEVFAITAQGEVKGKFTGSGPAVGGLFSSVPTLTAGAILYVGSGNGHLYAFQASSAFAASGWPMFGRNVAHVSNLAMSLLAEPRLSIVKPSETDQRLRLWSEHGTTLRLEATSDLRTWETLTTIASTGLEIEWSDPAPPSTQRFYRLMLE